MTQYKTVGLDVGLVGRWSRLGWGILILAPIIFDLTQNFDAARSPGFLGLVVLYLVGIAAVYTVAYFLLAGSLLARTNPWLSTLVFVGPALLVGWWNLAIAPVTGLFLPSALGLAMVVYIGLSFLLQWRIKYGGCEVVSLPILLFKRRYVTYCIPLVAVDAAEKQFVNAGLTWQKALWGVILATLLAVLAVWVITGLF